MSFIDHFRVLVPLFQNESKCETFDMQFHFHVNQSHFHKNGVALSLALKQRHKGNGLLQTSTLLDRCLALNYD